VNRATALLATTALMASLQGCGAGEGGADAIYVSGLIDDNTVQYVKSNLTSRTATLVVTSQGGEIEAALEISRIVMERQLDVVVRKLCASGCASHIFVAGRKRHIENNSLVIFHRTATSMVALSESVPLAAPAAWLAEYLDLQSQERQVYSERGVSQDLLIDPELVTEPGCIGYVRAKDGHMTSAVARRYRGWMPSVEYMKSKGVEFSGYWPSTQQEFSNLMEGISKGDAGRTRFGNIEALRQTGSSREKLKASVKICPFNLAPTIVR